MNNQPTNGRPKTKGPLRNFRLREPADDFLTDEATRTNRSMTAVVERALVAFSKLKASERDHELSRTA